MSRDELLAALKALQDNDRRDPERDHLEADEALLAFINDPDVTKAFEEIDKWYRETGGQSAPARMVNNASYLAVIGMGARAIVPILRALRDRGGYWYPALRAICDAEGIEPPQMPDDARGDVQRMTCIWIAWGAANGHVA